MNVNDTEKVILVKRLVHNRLECNSSERQVCDE